MRDKKEKRRQKSKLLNFASILCIAVLLFSIFNIVKIFLEYKEAEDFYDSTAGEYTQPANQTAQDTEKEAPIDVDFEELRGINQDIIGWIYMEDTVVNYPILQGENNFYYLDKTYFKKYLASGSIYLDAGNSPDFSDPYSIIYGHNMKNHTMFGDMDFFTDEEYRKAHPYVYILLPDDSWKMYEIISAHQVNVDDGTYDIDISKSKLEEGETVITLSTCTEDSADDRRFVVQAKLIEES